MSKRLSEKANRMVNQTNLSQREAEVLVLKQSGITTHEEIANRLGVAESTVAEYERRVQNKRKVAERTAMEIDNVSPFDGSHLHSESKIELRQLVERLDIGDRVLFNSSNRKSMKRPFEVSRCDRQETKGGVETRVKLNGPKGGQMEILVEPDKVRPWQVYADGAHEENPVRWQLAGLSIVAGSKVPKF